jgi:hypothetical protein
MYRIYLLGDGVERVVTSFLHTISQTKTGVWGLNMGILIKI